MSRPPFGRSPTPSSNGKKDRGLQKRQYVRFAFYKIDPIWRRLPPQKQSDQKRELLETIQSFDRRMLLRPYSTMGTRADAELLLWQIAESIEPFQALATAIMCTQMGAYLTLTYSYLAQTKRSIYEIRDNPDEDQERLIVEPTEARYMFVYPFIKTRPWYRMSLAARQGMMDEHIQVGRKYPSVKLNTTYSFGIDDQEFVVAFETDEPADFLDLVQELRETEASLFTLRDVPLYTCINMGLAESLDALGGPAIAEAKSDDGQDEEVWIDVCPAEEMADGDRKVVYLAGQQVGLFKIDGKYYALSNRCSHARGPLTEGDVDNDDCTVTCPWHYAKFDLNTGQVVDGVASTPVFNFVVEIRDGVIFVGKQSQKVMDT